MSAARAIDPALQEPLAANDNVRLTQHTDTQGNTRNIGYDSRGNVTALGSQGFRYDASDRPVALIDNGGEAVDGAYRYDGHGRRVKSIVDDGTTETTFYNVFDATFDVFERAFGLEREL